MAWWRLWFDMNGVLTRYSKNDGPYASHKEAHDWLGSGNIKPDVTMTWKSDHYPTGLRVKRVGIDWRNEE